MELVTLSDSKGLFFNILTIGICLLIDFTGDFVLDFDDVLDFEDMLDWFNSVVEVVFS